MQKEPVEKIGQRTATRFLSDAYCKGIVRGQVECCNLRAYQKGSCVVAAERISTAAFCSFPARALLQAVKCSRRRRGSGALGQQIRVGQNRARRPPKLTGSEPCARVWPQTVAPGHMVFVSVRIYDNVGAGATADSTDT